MASAAATAPQPAQAAVAGDIPLDAGQLGFFETFGYLQLPGAIAAEFPAVDRAFEEIWANRGGGHGGKPHDGVARSCIVPFVDQHAVLSALLDHPRIHGALVSLLGDDFNYMGSDGNYYVGDTHWHPDGHKHERRFVKVAIYLEELDGSSGALRVIPGSHHNGPYREAITERVQQSGEKLGVHGRDVPAVALATRPGDVAIFNHATWHSSWNGGKRRRMFTMNCCQRYPDDKLPLLREYIASHARFLIERNVGPEMLRTATPARMRHLEQVMANDGLLTERTRELRAQGVEPSRG